MNKARTVGMRSSFTTAAALFLVAGSAEPEGQRCHEKR